MVTINDFTMSAGSQITFNGAALTVNGILNVDGSNTEAMTNLYATIGNQIIINKNGTQLMNLSACTFYQNTIFNLDGSFEVYESYNGTTHFMDNATYNVGTSGNFFSCRSYPSMYHEDLTITRTSTGTSYLFQSGLGLLTGNFSFTNEFTGNTSMNNFNLPTDGPAPVIGGTININNTGNRNTSIMHIHNATSGGNITIHYANYFSLLYDTLLANISIVNYGGTFGDIFQHNHITGNLILTEALGNTGITYFGGNNIIGNTTITTNSSASFYTGFQQPD